MHRSLGEIKMVALGLLQRRRPVLAQMIPTRRCAGRRVSGRRVLSGVPGICIWWTRPTWKRAEWGTAIFCRLATDEA